jgi:hypothetical protein
MDPLTAGASSLPSQVVANIAPLKHTKLILRVHQHARNCTSIRRRPSREYHFSANNDESRNNERTHAEGENYQTSGAQPSEAR